MKRLMALGIVSVLLAASAGSASLGRAATTATHTHKSASVLLFVSGSLGDLGFFDSANAGVTRAAKNLGTQVKVVQNADSTQWQTQLLSLAGSKKYDLIILDASDATVAQAAAQVIKRYPDQRIIDFDDNTYAKTKSVSSIIYKQNEGSFLAGALAAMVVKSKLKYTSGKDVIGMVGGIPIQVILDFKVGYVQGAKAVDPNIDVRVTYVGGSGSNDTWNNKQKGAQLARSLYDAGAAVVYQVAGGSGLGVLDQSKISGRYAIGVDSNQDSFAPGHVIGSVVKRVDNSLYDLINLYQQGKLQGAHIYYYGLQNHGVDLTRDKYTREIITPSMYGQLDALVAKVMKGQIKVQSAYK